MHFFIPSFQFRPTAPTSGGIPSPNNNHILAGQAHVMMPMPMQHVMPNRVPRPAPPLMSSLFHGNNNFTIQQAGSESQFPWFNQQNVNHAAIHLPVLPRTFNTPPSPSQSTLNWSAQPYYPHSITAISPPIQTTEEQRIPISPPLPSSPTSSPPVPQMQHGNSATGSIPNRIPDSNVYTNAPTDGLPQRSTPHGQWTFRNQQQPRCPFMTTDRSRRHVTSHHQAMYLNQFPHQTNNIHYFRPAYAPHETLWYRQQNNQEMHRRHMMHPTPVDATNPHSHQHTTNIRLLGPNTQPTNMVYCLSCDQQHLGTSRRVRSYMSPFPGVTIRDQFI